MALLKCRECGREISSEAAACPHCGFPYAPPVSTAPPAMIIVPQPQANATDGIGYGAGCLIIVGAVAAISIFSLWVTLSTHSFEPHKRTAIEVSWESELQKAFLTIDGVVGAKVYDAAAQIDFGKELPVDEQRHLALQAARALAEKNTKLSDNDEVEITFTLRGQKTYVLRYSSRVGFMGETRF